ncbi:MAG: hypothetical protein B6U94_02580 [Thermofilum sp. ex4484_79]|nr:MAG: hypothetical protein B6U94_02580 [Thermofilum sp. ex4484_79]
MAVYKVRAKYVEKFRSVVDNTRGHSVVCDLPAKFGGNDTGPTALELAVMALADCILTILALVSSKMKIEIKDIEVTVEAVKPDTAKTITEFNVNVKVVSPAPKEEVEKAIKRTWEICPVGLLLEKAAKINKTSEIISA